MAPTSSLLLAVLSVLVFEFATCMHNHASSQSFISGDNHIGLNEMNLQCCHTDTKWVACCHTTNMLLSTRNNTAKECIKEHTVMKLLPKVHFVDKENCPNKRDKATARNYYCKLLNDTDKYFVEHIIPALTATKDCIAARNWTNLRSPGHIVETIKRWHAQTRARHNTTNCCYKPFFSTKTEAELLSDHIIFIDNSGAVSMAKAKADQTKKCTDKWDSTLAKVATYMEIVEILESLGRRDSCLRGCVKMETVECVDSLLYN